MSPLRQKNTQKEPRQTAYIHSLRGCYTGLHLASRAELHLKPSMDAGGGGMDQVGGMAILKRKLKEGAISHAEFECLVAAEERAVKLSGELDCASAPSLADRLESVGLRVFSFKQLLDEDKKSFVQFYIECTNQGRPPWTVRRRYSQFYSFFLDLKKKGLDCDGINFPKKQFGKLNTEQIEKRRAALNDFLNDLLHRRRKLTGDCIAALGTFIEFEEHDSINTAAASQGRYATLESIELG
jgi:hypothetical protein